MTKLIRAIGNALLGTKDKATIEESKARENRAVGTITAARRKAARVAATATACALLLLAPACASFPRAEFRLSAFGFEVGVDTRKLTDDIGNVSATMTQAAGLEPLVLDASAETVTAAEPVK